MCADLARLRRISLRRSGLTPRQRGLTDVGKRRRRGDAVGVDLEVEDRRQSGFARLRKAPRKFVGALDHKAETAKRSRIRGEIGIGQVRGDHTAWKIRLLMHPYRAIARIVANDENDRQAILHGCRELLSVHEKIAVARE